jgi:SAM-dependent methyltransferase
MYVEKLPTPEALAEIYTSDTYYELPDDSMKRIVDENKRRLKLIQNIKPKGKFLDIGCAHGLLLDQAQQEGYETFGVEPTLKNAEEARGKDHDVFNGWLNDFVIKCGDKRFEVITCLDVIEHIDEPKLFLAMAVSLLADDGVIVVSTPNYSGLIAKLLGSRDPYMTPPEHITFFTVNGIQRLAARCGLEVHLFQCFGSLVTAEMDRSIKRYIPKSLQFIAPLIRPVVRLSFRLMNKLNVGLEQEFYLIKKYSK